MNGQKTDGPEEFFKFHSEIFIAPVFMTKSGPVYGPVQSQTKCPEYTYGKEGNISKAQYLTGRAFHIPEEEEKGGDHAPVWIVHTGIIDCQAAYENQNGDRTICNKSSR